MLIVSSYKKEATTKTLLCNLTCILLEKFQLRSHKRSFIREENQVLDAISETLSFLQSPEFQCQV